MSSIPQVRGLRLATTSPVDLPDVEAIERFPCFGGNCAALVIGSGPAGTPREAVVRIKRALLAWHKQLSRFEPDSELSRLNRDPRATVEVSSVMTRFVEVALDAAATSGGLVDPTLADEIARVGYSRSFASTQLPLRLALSMAPSRTPARSCSTAVWRSVTVDRRARTVTRPPGVMLDSGGIVKGMFGDILASVLSEHEGFAVDAAGDVRFGGAGLVTRPVRIASPFDESVLHVFDLVSGAVATSGIGKRSWLDADGHPAHHLLDPSTGRPAFTGVVQVTALASSGVEAEWRSKAALLSGAARARGRLPHGGLVVYDDETFEVIGPRSLTEDAVA
jgi:FAD:protein FMN transferase